MLNKARLPFVIFSFIIISLNVKANSNQPVNISVEGYFSNETFNNIIPLKQLINDNWKRPPNRNASNAFTQNEMGIRTSWNNFTMTLASRFDYFIETNEDTAKAFYRNRNKNSSQAIQEYNIQLSLKELQTNGLRIGYTWNTDTFSSQLTIGYWDINSLRDSHLSGALSWNNSAATGNEIDGNLQLSEYYTKDNLLKRPMSSWNTDGFGATIDARFNWQFSKKLLFNLNIKDLYSLFKINNIGYSNGQFNTDSSYINSLGGQAFLPLYKGIETSRNQSIKIPSRIDFLTKLSSDNINYLLRFKYQGNVKLYYLGGEFLWDNTAIKFLLDIEHLTPEIQVKKSNYQINLSADNININKIWQINLGVNYSIHF